MWLLKILSHTLQTLTQNTTFGLVQSISHPESLCIKREWFLCIENDANINLVEYLLIITLIMEYKKPIARKHDLHVTNLTSISLNVGSKEDGKV